MWFFHILRGFLSAPPCGQSLCFKTSSFFLLFFGPLKGFLKKIPLKKGFALLEGLKGFLKKIPEEKGFALLEFMLALTLSSFLLTGIFQTIRYYRQEEAKKNIASFQKEVIQNLRYSFLQQLYLPPPRDIFYDHNGYIGGYCPKEIMDNASQHYKIPKNISFFYGVYKLWTNAPTSNLRDLHVSTKITGKQRLCLHFFPPKNVPPFILKQIKRL